MANELLQLQIDETLCQEAAGIYARLGLDLSTAIRIFLTRSIQVRGIPFSMQLPDENVKATAAIAAMRCMNRMAEENGIADMSLDEINAEIAAARNELAQE